MSIFPRRAARGGAVTLHVRRQVYPGSAAGWMWIDLTMTSPAGRVTTLARHFRVLPSLSTDATSEQGTRFRFAPVLLASEPEFPPRAGSEGEQEAFRTLVAACNRPRALDTLAITLARLKSSAHYYYHVPVPADAELGRHRVNAALSGGPSWGSSDLPEDCFFVDHLEIVRSWSDEAGFHVEVHNPGPEGVPALLLPLGEPETSGHVVEIPAGSRSIFDLARSPVLLAYAEGARYLVATGDASPLVIRNPRWSVERIDLPERSDGALRVHDGGGDGERILTGDAARAFLRGDGTRSRAQMEQEFPNGEARELMESALLIEMALDAGEHERRESASS